jgi:pilus assembly protein CpaE
VKIVSTFQALTRPAFDFKCVRRAWSSFRGAESGVSALEFGLFAPILLISLLSVADLAFAAYQRMMIDHVLRAGAQRAMLDQSVDPTAPKVIETLRLMASENFTLDSSTPVNGKPPLTVSASRYCVCPQNPDIHVSCGTACSNSKSTLAYYSLSAHGRSTSMLLPQMSFSPKLQVQVR